MMPSSPLLLRQPKGRTPAHMRGIGLIEVMVSVLILAVGLLGVAAMQSLALRNGQSSLESSQAVMQTTSIIEAMRANPGGNYNTAMMCTAPAASTTLVSRDLHDWVTSLKTTIGVAGDGTTCGQISGCPGACVIDVRWSDARAGGGATRTIRTEATI